MNETVKTATAFDMLLEIFRTRQHRYELDPNNSMSLAYSNAADLLEYAMRDDIPCMCQYEGRICSAMQGLTVDEYQYLKRDYESTTVDSARHSVVADLMENRSCRIGPYVMSCDAGDPDYRWHLGCPGNMLMVKGSLAMVLDIFMMIVHGVAKEGGNQE